MVTCCCINHFLVSDITLHHFLPLLQVMIVMELLEKGDLRSYLLTVE